MRACTLTNINNTKCQTKKVTSNAYSADFTYDVSGNILTLKRKDAIGSLMDNLVYTYENSNKSYQLLKVTDYVGNLVYGNGELRYMLTSEGRLLIDGTSQTYEYHLKDHLGNTRLAFTDDDGNGTISIAEISQVADYYPFGLRQEPKTEDDPNQKYLYNGKELQEDLDWYDYGARMYDPQLGRFTTVDPLTEKNHFQSGFVYAANNPILYMDYMGLDTFNINIENQTINRTTVKKSETHTYVVVNGDETTTTTLDVNNAGLVKFPANGNGFSRYGPEDEGGDHYLKPIAAAALFGLITEMTNEIDGFNIALGDMSSAAGTAPGNDHRTHGGPKGYSGVCVDFQYLDKDGSSFQGFSNEAKFNAWNNAYFFKKAGEWGFTKNYISNQKDVWSFMIRSGATGNIKTTFYPMNVNGAAIDKHGHHGHLTYMGITIPVSPSIIQRSTEWAE